MSILISYLVPFSYQFFQSFPFSVVPGMNMVLPVFVFSNITIFNAFLNLAIIADADFWSFFFEKIQEAYHKIIGIELFDLTFKET